MNNAKWNKPELLTDSHHGIYCPQLTVKALAPIYQEQIKAKHFESFEAVCNGPDSEWYWGSWEDILNMTFVTPTGQKWSIYQNEDVWAVPACFARSKAANEFFESY